MYQSFSIFFKLIFLRTQQFRNLTSKAKRANLLIFNNFQHFLVLDSQPNSSVDLIAVVTVAMVCQFRLMPDNSSRKIDVLTGVEKTSEIFLPIGLHLELFLCCPFFQWTSFVWGKVGVSLDPDPLPQLISSEFSIGIKFKNAFWVQLKKFFFLFKIPKRNLKHIINNRYLFLLISCQLFPGWATRKLGYGQDTDEQSKSDLLLLTSVLFQIRAWIWAQVQNKHLKLLTSRHFLKKAYSFPATPRSIEIYIIVNIILTNSLSIVYEEVGSQLL